MQKGLIAVVIVVVLAVGGWLIFGKNDKKDSTTTAANTDTMQNMKSSSDTSSNASPSPSTSDQTPASTSSVTIQNFAFSPASITVKKGTIVTWTNKDSSVHTVTETDGKKGPNSGNLSNGKTYSFTFNETGTFSYKCSIHPDMTGSVTVTE